MTVLISAFAVGLLVGVVAMRLLTAWAALSDARWSGSPNGTDQAVSAGQETGNRMSDLPERLRKAAELYGYPNALLSSAADEIERLRLDLDEARIEKGDKIRALDIQARELDRYRAWHWGRCDCHDSWDQCPCAAAGHPKDHDCGCCDLGTGLCGPRGEDAVAERERGERQETE